MELDTPSLEVIIIWLIIGTLSAWGGLVRYIIDIKENNDKWDNKKVLSQIIVSNFAGFLGGFLSFESGVSLYITFAISGLFGTMGCSGIHYLWKKLFNHRGKNE
ncbi:phage holin family protein [Yersinia pseudotuberculosis]|uniref:phage holin family protein n=1 Tax=Yersinia pseudotuberculosis TaxID=633 RepID=UPI0005DF7E44|nr:phage holin family protein [Yersinia pseudotuberculosis]CND36187.1 putative phage-like protein [Yersinia pseudotuberculosis]